MKTCTKCKISKDFDLFSTDKNRIDGKHSWCKVCHKNKNDFFRSQHVEEIKQQRKVRGWDYRNKKKSQSDYTQSLKGKLTSWKASAKLRKITWNLTLDELNKLEQICFYTGLPLTCESNNLTTISLDRLDSNREYTIDNVVFCCAVVNKMKQDLSVEEFKRFCNLVVNKK